jgi:hypothetical protein
LTTAVDPVATRIASSALAGASPEPTVGHELLEVPLSVSRPVTIRTGIEIDDCSTISVCAVVERDGENPVRAIWQMTDGKEFLIVADSKGLPCECGESCGTPVECASIDDCLTVRLNFAICDGCSDDLGPYTVTSVRVYVSA